MKTDSYYLFLKKYLAEHKEDFIASHETNNPNVPNRILSTGLRVSHSPYGKKFRHCVNEDGSIDFKRSFMATMFVLDSKTLDDSKFYFENPTAPIIINIPAELLKIIDAKNTDEYTHHFFSEYGFEERPVEGEGRCGKITPLESSKGANVMILPSYFIVGYYDPVKEVFVKNDKHFSNLSQEEQEKIIKFFMEKQEHLDSQSQPQ